MEAGEWAGSCWLPGDATRRVHGTLVYSSDQFTLNLDGPLILPSVEPGQVFHDIWSPTTHDVVHGRLDDNRPATLADVHGNAIVIPFGEGGEVWRPRFALLGVELTDPDEPVFTQATISFDNLDSGTGTLHRALAFRWRRTPGF